MIRYVLQLLAILLVIGCSQDEASSSSDPKLQEFMTLFQNESYQDAFILLESHQDSVLAAINESQDAKTYVVLGRTYFYAEIDSKALEAFSTALDIDPSQSEAHFFSGLIHRFSGDLEKSEQSFREAININSHEDFYFVELGLTLELQGNTKAASIAFKDALNLNETNFDAHFKLATIYIDEGDLENAERHFLAAVEQRQNDPNSHYNLGQLYQDTKQHDLAINRFKKVLELTPNDWRAVAKLVQEYQAVGDDVARDLAVQQIYKIWRGDTDAELRAQGYYVREQKEIDGGKVFVFEYFELTGERPRKYSFKLQDTLTENISFTVSLGSYEKTTKFVRSKGKIGADERVYHLDGYSPEGNHFTYAFFYTMPTYDEVRDITLKVLADDYEAISSTILKP